MKVRLKITVSRLLCCTLHGAFFQTELFANTKFSLTARESEIRAKNLKSTCIKDTFSDNEMVSSISILMNAGPKSSSMQNISQKHPLYS